MSETLVACCSEKKNNNEGSVKNNHKLYIFRKPHTVMRQSANPKPLLRQKVGFNPHCLSNPKAMRFIRQFLFILLQVYIAIFIDAHMILSHHIIMCKYEAEVSEFFSRVSIFFSSLLSYGI